VSRSRQQHHSNQDSYQEPCFHYLSPVAKWSPHSCEFQVCTGWVTARATTVTLVASFQTTSLDLTGITRSITRRRATRRRRPIREVVRRDPHGICRGFAQEIPDTLILEAHETDVQRWIFFLVRLGFSRGKEGQHRKYKRCDNDEHDQFIFHVCAPQSALFLARELYQSFGHLARNLRNPALFASWYKLTNREYRSCRGSVRLVH
jgi:hypothetical protein